MLVGTVMNLASPSLIERMIWTPVSAALAVLLWKAAKSAMQERLAAGETGVNVTDNYGSGSEELCFRSKLR